ncbi:AN1-type zinc finger protein 1-like [Diachasma alloeum]|uniref:AN1-type zinc finger protein 1-like n=1 Tax=Diachasma alloeum TaxID=454923 RepID=UPI0007384AC0|nr:AN1-type zinc finger protein 1-like [Diachasma alloeum]
MEFPEVGTHCAIDSCKQDDFLPFKCTHCSSIFCKNHFNVISHNCKACPENIVLEPRKIQGFICSQELCKSSSPVEMNCIECKKHFCLAHRHHGCLEISEDEIAMKLKEWAKPKEEFKSAKSTVDAAINENLKKSKKVGMANKVQLIRLKGKAIGSQTIPSVDRRYFQVYFPLTACKKESAAVFVNVQWTLGKAIDSIAEILKIRNSNNLAHSDKLKMFHHATGDVLAEKMDTTLSDLFSKTQLVDGQRVIFEYSNGNKVDFSLYK